MNYKMTFKDYYYNTVTLSFEKQPFSDHPKHVWVICRYRNQWLLTKHPSRGIEFPGGKVEENEAVDDAAIREVYEETGARVTTLTYIGQYKVDGKADTIIKNIYFANVDDMDECDDYYETEGPLLLKQLPSHLHHDNRFSFMMKDRVLVESMKQLKRQGLI